MFDRGQVETGEMKQLQPCTIAYHPFQIARFIAAARGESDKMFIAATIRNLHKAKAIAQCLQPHRFSVDGNRPCAAKDIVGKVLLMKKNGHLWCSILLVCDMHSAVPDCAIQGKFRGNLRPAIFAIASAGNAV
jgi:hypothetical protein